MQQFEEQLTFLRRLKHDTVIFGDFNIDPFVDSKSRNGYEKLLYAFDFKQQIFQPTRDTATSSTYLDHFITSIKRKHRQFPQQLVIISVF